MKHLFMSGFLVLLVAFGSYCLFSPRGVQAFALKAASRGLVVKNAAVMNYLRSEGYVASIRIVGLIAYSMAVLLAFAIYRSGVE